MQKKVLLSLLAAAPVAFTASAHENVNFDNLLQVNPTDDVWEYNGMSAIQTGPNRVEIQAAAAMGPVTVDIIKAYEKAFPGKQLPAGEYKITGFFKNATVKVNDKVFTSGNTISYNGEGKLTLSVESAYASDKFEFGDVTLALVCDFSQIATDLTSALGRVDALTQLTAQNPASDEYNTLTTEAEELNAKKEAIEKTIAEIAANDETSDYYLNLYTTYNLGITPNHVNAAINQYSEQVAEYNTKAAAENARYAIEATNRTTYNDLNGKLNTLKSSVEAFEETLTVGSYAQTQIAEALKKLNEDIDNLQNELNSTFMKDGKIIDTEIIDGTDLAGKIYLLDTKEFAQIQVNYRYALEDQEAYDAWYNQYNLLKKAQDDANTSFAAAKPEDIYQDMEEAYTADVADIVTKALDKCDIKLTNPPTDAFIYKDKDIDILQVAIRDIQSKVSEYNDIVKTQNDLKAAADTAIADKIKEVDDIISGLPSNLNDEAKQRLTATAESIKQDIAAQQTAVDDAYKAHTLTAALPDFTQIDLDIKALQDDVTKAVEQNNVALSNQAFVNKVKDAYEQLVTKANETFAGTELDGKFNPTLENIKNDIDKFTAYIQSLTEKGEYADGQSTTGEGFVDMKATDWQENLLNSIGDTSKLVDTIKKQLDSIKAVISGMEAQLADFQKEIDSKQVVKDADGIALVNKDEILGEALSNLAARVKGYQTDLENVDGTNNLILQEGMADLAAKMEKNELTFQADVNTAIFNFSKGVTEANNNEAQQAAKNAFNYKLHNLPADAEYAGKEAFEKIANDLSNKRSNLMVAVSNAKTADEYDELDPTCQEVYDAAISMQAEAEKLVANNTAKDKLDKLATVITNEISSLREWLANPNNCNQPARTHYEGIVDGMEKEFEAITDSIATDYEAIALAGKVSEYDGELQGLLNELANLKTDAAANESNHNSQLKYAENLDSRYTDVLKLVDTKDAAIEVIKAAQEALDAVLGSITDFKQDVFDAYSKGQCANEADTFKSDYDSIMAELDRIAGSLDEYRGQVMDYNNKQLDDQKFTYTDSEGNSSDLNWAGWKKTMDQVYNNAVSIYRLYDVSSQANPGYAEFVGDKIKKHVQIVDFINNITELDINVTNFVNGLTNDNDKEPQVLTREMIQQQAIDKAQDIINGINAALQAMKDEANQLAAEYWAQEDAKKQTIIGNAIRALTAAGVSDEVMNEYVNPAIEAKVTATRMYETAVKAGYPSVMMGGEYVKNSDKWSKESEGIADWLDKITESSLDLQGAAKTQWNLYVNSAKATLDGYKTAIDSYEMLTDEEKETAKTEIDALLPEINDLNTEVLASDDVLAGLPDFKTRLDEILAKGEAIDTGAASLNTGREAEKNELDKRTDQADACVNDLDALRQWIDGMAIEPEIDVDAIAEAIDAVKALIANKSGMLLDADVQKEMEADFAGINQSIADAYSTAFDEEKIALKNLVVDALMSLNEWKQEADLDSPGEVVAMKDRIDAINAAIEKIQKGTSMDVAEALKKNQKELCNIINELAEKRNLDPTPTNTAFDNLEKIYDTINGQLETMFDGVDDSVKSKFEEEANKLATELNDIRNEYSADKNSLIATEDSFANELNGVGTDVTALEAEVKQAQADFEAEQERKAVSDAAAAELQTQIDAMQNKLDALRTFIEGTSIYDTIKEEADQYLAALQNKVTELQSWLDNEKAAYALTADSTLPANSFDTWCDGYTEQVARMESMAQIEKAGNAVNTVETIILGNGQTDDETLMTKLTALQERVKALVAANTIEGTNALTEEVKAIIADAEALADEAEEAKIILGDVNGDGKFSSTDISAILDVIATQEGNEPAEEMLKRADLNNDGSISVADAVLLIQKLMGDPNDGEAVLSRLASRAMPDAVVRIQALDAGREGQSRHVQINLVNSVDFVAGQFDIKLPAGMQILSESLSDRTEGMTLQTGDPASNIHRVVFLSENLRELEGNEGIVFDLEVIGDGNIYIENALFADVNGIEYRGSDPGTTGIDGVLNTLSEGAHKIYDAAGRMMNKLQQGVNIITNGKGKGTKVYRKK